MKYVPLALWMSVCIVTPTITHAFTTSDARACVQNGINQVQESGDLQSYIDARVSIDNLAARAARRAWGGKWSDLPDNQKTAARKATQRYLQDSKALDDIKRDTIKLDRVATDKKLKNGVVEISGRFKTKSGRTETFSVRVIKGCYVVEAFWQNARLSNQIANKLK